MSKLMQHGKMIIAIVVMFVLLTLAGYLSRAYASPATPQAVAGVLDLRDWDVKQGGPIALSGDWEFYWNRLYTGTESGLGTTIQPDGIMRLPGSWRTFIGPDGAPLGAYGYITLRLRVLLPETPLLDNFQSLLRIALEDAGSAYRLQVFDATGQPLSSRMEGGRVGTDQAVSRPARRSITFPVQAAREWIIVWQISNFTDPFRAGPFFSPQLGDDAQLSHALTMGRLAIALNTGILLVMGIYHLVLFVLRPRDKTLLWFGLLCFDAALRMCGTENCFGLLFPDADVWMAGHLAELISFGSGVPIFILFLKAVFPQQAGERFPKIFVALAGIYLSSLLLTPVRIHFSATIAYEIVTIFAAIWVIAVLIRAIKAGQRLAWIIAVGSVVLVACVINDMLYAELLIKSVDLAHYGQSFFILCQAVVIAFANQKAHNAWHLAEQEKHAAQAEALRASHEKERFVGEQNKLLEQKVQARTEELLKAKQAAEIAQRAAEEANQAKSTFLASMSHELRTPLTAVLGYAEILQLEEDLEDRHYKAAATIHRCGEHLLLMINDLLDLSKIEAGKIELTPRKFPLPHFLRNLVTNAQFRAIHKDLTLQADLAPQLPNIVSADERRLRQVLENLLNNAIKFTDNGCVTLRVKVNGERSTDKAERSMVKGEDHFSLQPSPFTRHLTFEVEDSGIGISAADLQKIFVPFYQVREARLKGDGSGLGLAISRELVHLMGGELQVKSVPGQGTTFWFDLTLPVTDQSHAANSLQMVSCITGYKGTKRKILIVDDNRENRTLLKDILSPLGFALMEARDGQEALNATQQFLPDLILMDIFMPGINGIEATRHLQRLLGSHAVIGISASPQVQQGSLAAGCDAFLVKPVQIDQLLTCVGHHLQLEWEYITPEITPSNNLFMTELIAS